MKGAVSAVSVQFNYIDSRSSSSSSGGGGEGEGGSSGSSGIGTGDVTLFRREAKARRGQSCP